MPNVKLKLNVLLACLTVSIISVALLLLLNLINDASFNMDLPSDGTMSTGFLNISIIDVGLGDSILIQSPLGKNLLIDGGQNSAANAVENCLRTSNVTKLDVIITHTHFDHIESLDSVIRDFSVDTIYMPQMKSESAAFKELERAMNSKGLTFKTAKSGVSVDLGSGVAAQFIAPVKDHYDQFNDYSAVLKVTYGATSFLFTGDAEVNSEYDMIALGTDLRSTVLKVAHHGSDTSTSEAFLHAVNPEYAIISVGENKYGYPSAGTLTKLRDNGTVIYRTDESGTIVMKSDGTNITFNTKPATP